MSRRPRCSLCRRAFDPHPRVGPRQKVCSADDCQKARRQRTQKSWRDRHPGYFVAWRATERDDDAKKDVVSPPRLPPPLSKLPWETAQDEFGVVGAEFLAAMGRAVLTHAKDQFEAQSYELIQELGAIRATLAKDQIEPHSTEIIEKSDTKRAGPPKDQISGVPL